MNTKNHQSHEQLECRLLLEKNQKELSNYFKKNLIDDEIIIGMGAGSISKWMRELKSSL